MIRSQLLTRIGTALSLAAMLSACASFPAMTVGTASKDGRPQPAMSGSRGGPGSARVEPQVVRVPGAVAPAARPVVPELTAAQIAQAVPDEPIGATLPPQPLPQFLNTLFSQVLKVPYTLGPDIAQRTEVITLNAPPSMSKRSYVAGLQNSLRIYGLSLTLRGGAFFVTDEGGGGGSPGGGAAPLTIIRSRSSADTPLGARSVAQYFQLVALQASAVKDLVDSMVGKGRCSYTVDDAANAILIQCSGRQVAQAVDILRNLDQPAFAGAQVIRLEPVFWSADTFATALMNTLAAEGYIVSTDPLGPKSILVLPLLSTNQTLVFAADTATMERVRYWARELDQASALGDQNSTFVYEVRNTGASAIGTMLINAGTSQQRAQGVAGGAGGALGQALNGPGGAAAQAGRGNVNNNAAGGRGGVQAQGFQNNNAAGGRGGGQGNNANRAGAGANRGTVGINGNTQTTTGQAFGGVVPGGGAITVDDAGNRILFTGTATQFASIRNLLQQLDQPARQVRVEVTVAEVTLTDETRLGLEWFFNGMKNNDGYFGGTRTYNNVTTSTTTGGVTTTVTAASPTSGLGLGSNGLNLGFIRTDALGAIDMQASFNAFASNNKVNVLSRPSLTARSGTPGSIQVGADVPYVQQQRAANNGTTTADILATYTYRQTGVILQLTPTVYGDDRVDLNIYQEVSSDRVNPNPAIPSPIFDTRVLTTTLSLSDGETGVLGGLIEDNYGKGNAGIPFLKDIPILGQAFRVDTVSGRKTELMVLITPFIIRDRDDMNSISNQMTSQINQAFANVRGGSYTLTPWATGQNIGLGIPSPKITQEFARPTPNGNPAPAPPAAAVPATIPAAGSSGVKPRRRLVGRRRVRG